MVIKEVINVGKHEYKISKFTNKNTLTSFYIISRNGYSRKDFDTIKEIEEHYPNLVGKITI